MGRPGTVFIETDLEKIWKEEKLKIGGAEFKCNII